jgi:TolA-binding protein
MNVETAEEAVKQEWANQPVSLVIHIITLLIMLMGFGATAAVMKDRQDSSAVRMDRFEMRMETVGAKSSDHDAQIAVIRNELGNIKASIDRLPERIREGR